MNKQLEKRTGPFVGVVVLNHNGIVHLEECFSSLMKLDYKNVGFLMVDNASSDGSRDFMRRRFSNVRIVQNRRNEHFAKGMNIGMNYWLERKADYIALINNDIELDPAWLSELIKVAERDVRIGAVASRMMYYHNRKIINGLGVNFNIMAYAWDGYQGKMFKKHMERSEEVFSFCGGAALLNSAALREVGLFDPWHKIYLEDVDLCFRLHARGWRVVTAPLSVAYHKFSATMKQGAPLKDYLILRNRLKVALEYFPSEKLWPRIIKKIVRKEMQIARHWLKQREWLRCWLQLKAFITALLAMPKILHERKVNANLCGYSTFKLLLSTFEPDVLPYFKWDYERADRGEIKEQRIIMGVSDKLLGDGWYTLELSPPQNRWTCDEADCLLRAQKDAPSVLQLHVRQPVKSTLPQNLAVYVDDEKVGSCIVSPSEWQTYHFCCTPKRDIVKVTFKLDRCIAINLGKGLLDVGLQFNEISLLSKNSQFIRAICKQQ